MGRAGYFFLCSCSGFLVVWNCTGFSGVCNDGAVLVNKSYCLGDYGGLGCDLSDFAGFKVI